VSTPYAAGTEVSADRSKAEIERTLRRFGAEQFAYGWEDDRIAVGFRLNGRAVRIVLTMPPADDPALGRTPTGRARSAPAIRAEHEKETRRRWRALAAVIKAKLVAVEEGISTIEREFLADMLLPDGRTLAEHVVPRLDAIGNGLPALLPGRTKEAPS
jgi:hypothetical protein